MKPNLLLLVALAGLAACDNHTSEAPSSAAQPRADKSNVFNNRTPVQPQTDTEHSDRDIVEPNRIRVGDSKVTFIPPAGFSQFSEELIAAKWPSSRAPAYVVGTPTGSTSVAYDLKPHHCPQEKLPEMQKTFTQGFERMIPGLDWKMNEIIEHSGQRWLLMEMTSNAIDTDIYNMMMLTGVDGKMLVFNFNSTKEDFPKYEEALRESMNSIRLPQAGVHEVR